MKDRPRRSRSRIAHGWGSAVTFEALEGRLLLDAAAGPATAELGDPGRAMGGLAAPPAGYAYVEPLSPQTVGDSLVISSVPEYFWHHGCGPTAAAMVLGYWDGAGYDDFYSGDAATQTSAVNEGIASKDDGRDTTADPGTPGTGHVADYAYYDGVNDDSAGSPYPDMSEIDPAGAHTDDSVADFMHTSRSGDGLKHGWTSFSRIDDGFEDYSGLVGYTGAQSSNEMFGAFTWSDLVGEIDAGRPMVFLVDTDGDGGTDHFVPAIGYRTSPRQQYACYTTWSSDPGVHWFDWQAVVSGNEWGIYGATYFVPPAPSDVGDALDAAQDTSLGGGSYTLDAQIGNGDHGDMDVDVFSLTVTADNGLIATTSLPPGGSGMDTVLRLFDASGTELAFNDDSDGLYSRIEYTFPADGTYYVGVSGYDNDSYDPTTAGSGANGDTGDYRLTMDVTALAGGTIRGTVWNDLDGDGQKDDGEAGLPDRRVYLDTDFDGQWDAGEDYQITGADGTYAFSGLEAGTYVVAQEPQAGWTQTFPGAGAAIEGMGAAAEEVVARFARSPATLDANGAAPVDTSWIDGSGPSALRNLDLSAPAEASGASGALAGTGVFGVYVEDGLLSSVQSAINTYTADLAAEGYQVTVEEFSGTAEDLRAALRNEWITDGLEGALFVGDLPHVNFTSEDNWDSPSSQVTYAHDLYFMDLDGTYVLNATGLDEHTDGSGDVGPEIYVSRITTGNLGGILPGEDEASLINAYFAKAHAYRTGGLVYQNRGIVFADDDWDDWGAEQMDDLYAYADILEINDPALTTKQVYMSTLQLNYESILECLHSSATYHAVKVDSSSEYIYNSEIVNANPRPAFYNMFNCSSASFTSSNHLIGAYVYGGDYGLNAVGSTKTGSMLYFSSYYQAQGAGDSVGQAFAEWFDVWARGTDDAVGDTWVDWFYGMTMQGDPTLKPASMGDLPGAHTVVLGDSEIVSDIDFGSHWLEPDINVQGNGLDIADGDTTPDSADHTDFGPADVGGATVTRTFTIENTGVGTLTLTGAEPVTISGAHAGDFSVTQPGATVLAAGASTTFDVTFGPTGTGTRTATVLLASDDPDEAPYDFTVQGAAQGGVAVSLDVDGNGQTEALSDGIVIIRYLAGFTGDALVAEAVDPNGSRTSPDDVAAFLAGGQTTMLDVDDNGSATPLTDGMVILRYLAGFTGPSLVEGAVDLEGNRIDPGDVIAFLESYDPDVPPPPASAPEPITDAGGDTTHAARVAPPAARPLAARLARGGAQSGGGISVAPRSRAWPSSAGPTTPAAEAPAPRADVLLPASGEALDASPALIAPWGRPA